MIENLYERLVDLLGKRQANHGNLLLQLKRDLGEEPVIQFSSEWYQFYDFPQSGISLDFDRNIEMFMAVTLFIQITPGPDGDVGPGKPYRGNLPYGIARDDSRELVEAKLPGCTIAVKDYRSDIDLRPLVFQCHFNASNHRLSMVSVDYLDTVLKPGIRTLGVE